MKIGVLGAGFMGSTHARALTKVKGVEVVAITARTPDRGEPLAHEIGARFAHTAEEIFSNPQIDAVDICLPTPYHRSLAERAIAAGKHVLLEKPLAMTLEDADALVDLAASTDKVFMIAHVLRFWPEYVELQKQVASGEQGQPISALAVRRQPYPAWSSLFKDASQTGGAVIDMLVHDFDALNWVMGTPTAVVARGVKHPEFGGYDQLQVMIEYAGGRSAVVDGGMLMPNTYPFTSSLEVLCENGALEYHFQAGGRSVEMGQGVNALTLYPDEGDPRLASLAPEDAYLNEVSYWVECIEEGKPADRATPTDARTALAVALAARRALDLPSLSPVLI